jgi:hypothetical protein
MSETTLRALAAEIREAAATVAWAQWAAIGSTASGSKAARSLVDPEALVLVSLCLREHERRLSDALAEWAPEGARLLSVQRIKNMARTMPETTRDRLESFAFLAHTRAGDPRWKNMYRPEDAASSPPMGRQRTAGRLQLRSDASLLLRLRLGLGVNLKTDVLTFLIATAGECWTVAKMAKALCYTDAATRRAAEDLVEARLIRARPGSKPREYLTDPGAWEAVLRPSGAVSPWVPWNAIFEFAARLDEWERIAVDREVGPWALNALGNELAQGYEGVFDLPRITGGWGQDSPAASFAERVRALCRWTVEQV